MPVKFVVLVVVVVAAAGFAVYENEDLRHNINDFFDRQRRKIAQHLHDLADNVQGSQNQDQRRGMREPMAMSSNVGEQPMRPGFKERAKTSAIYDVPGESVELRMRAARRLSEEEYGSGETKNKSGETATAAVVAAAAVAGVGVAVVSKDAAEEEAKTEKESGYESALTSTLPPLPSSSQDVQQQPIKQEEQHNESNASVIFSAPESFKALSEASIKTISADTENPFSDNNPMSPSFPHPPSQSAQGDQYWHIQQWAENTLAFEDGDDAASSINGGEDVVADTLSGRGSSMGSEFEDIGSVASWTEVGSEVSGDGH